MNKNVVVDKHSLFEKHLFFQGIVKIGDLLSNSVCKVTFGL